MKRIATQLAVLLLCCLSTLTFGSTDQDKTLSPYFMVRSADPNTDNLPLKSTSADVSIAGVIADVTITQVYKNEGKNTLEAIYVFPTSTKAAVYGMDMQIGDRTITAEIREKSKARAEYNAAKAEGKRVSLLEQERPNVFQMSVANIKAGDEIKVTLKYTELLVPTDGVYQFVYPTVVGPRFSTDNPTTSTDQYVASPYLKEGNMAPYNYDLNVQLDAGLPIQSLECTSHNVNTDFANRTKAKVTLKSNETNAGNRDYILEYRLAGTEIESGLLMYEGEKENFFLMMVQPPKVMEPKRIPPREFVFIIDVSGSMRGFALETTKKLFRDLVTNLAPGDKFNMILFAGTSGQLSPASLDVTDANVEKGLAFIEGRSGGGGTQLLPALQKALDLPYAEEGMSRSVVMITDGFVNVEKETFDLIRNNLGEANMFSFGIGSSVNRYIIEGIAHVGKGEPMIVTQEREAYEQADKFRQYVNSPCLTKIKVDYDGLDVYDVEPVAVPDMLAERPVVIFGKYRGDAKGKITLKGFAGRKKYKKTFDVSTVEPSQFNSALKYLWAREKIQSLEYYNRLRSDDGRIQEVTSLGLKYSLMTPYTSFIAVDEELLADASGAKKVTVKQAQPLPQNVQNSAVGFEIKLKGKSSVGGRVKTNAEKLKAVKIDLGKVVSNVSEATLLDLQSFLEAKLKEAVKKEMLKNAATAKVTVKLEIDASGKVKEVKIASPTLSKADADKLTKAIKAWDFSSLGLQNNTVIELPFTISK